ncbi:MAG: alpha/beta hydrolase [Pseudomonadota bacterium]
MTSSTLAQAQPRRWQVANRGESGGSLQIAGWDFGGSGEVAMLQHANGMCAALWAPLVDLLKHRYRVIAVDARGHGDSQHLTVPGDYAWSMMVDDLVAVSDALCEEFELDAIPLALGSSFGSILLAAAEARAHRFEHLVMLDPPIHPTAELVAAMGIDLTPPPSKQGALVEQTLKRKSVWASRQAARDAWREKPLFAPWEDAAFDLYLSEGMRDRADGQVELKCSPSVEAHIFASTGSLGLLEYAPEVRIPVRLVRAAAGHFSAEFYTHVAAIFPDCVLSELQAGHMLPFEVPDQVARLVLE